MLKGLKKAGLSVLILIGTFTPAYLFLAANSYFQPATFFEKAAMVVLGYIVLGGIQFWLLFGGIVAIIAVWSD